jgi:hypothetical protein
VGHTTRVAPALILLGLAGFVALTALAAAVYPGGTFCDAGAPRYEFWGNFFCDLTQPVTQRGADNARSRTLAQASFASFSLALIPFWWELGGLIRAWRGTATRVAGLLSALATNVIAWLPSAASPSLHQASVFVAALAGLGAGVLGVAGLVARGNVEETRTLRAPGFGRARAQRVAGWIGGLALLLGAADATYYAYAIAVPGCHALLPALQKLAALCVIAWMALVAWICRRPSRLR